MREPFKTFREVINEELCYCIVQRAWPHYLGIVTLVPVENTLISIPIAGYHLHITFDGVLEGNYVPGHKDVYKEIESVFTEMARWYLDKRIMVDEKKYKKWKLNVSSTTQ